MELGLKGRNAVITGGTRGIGKSIARALAKEGVNVVLLARSREALERTAEEIRRESGVQALGIPADVKSIKSVKAAAADVVSQLRPIHILVNNAGGPIRRVDRQIEWPDSDWIDDINMKIVGMLRCVQAFLPHLSRDGTGRVINISGIAGVGVLSGALTHGFNNSAMNHVTNYLAADLADDKISVNTVIPGLIATEWRELWADNLARQQGKTKAEFLSETCRNWGIVAGRWGTMEEVADSVVFLASDRARYITGAQLSVDGGFGVNKR